MDNEKEQCLAELRKMIEFINQQAMAESYKPFAHKFLAVSSVLQQVQTMVVNDQVGTEFIDG
jgi:hypothetical protein